MADLARHQLTRIRQIDQLYLDGKVDLAYVRAAFDQERPAMWASFVWAIQNISDPDAAQFCLYLPRMGEYTFDMCMSGRERADMLSAALRAMQFTRQVPKPDIATSTHHDLGWAYIDIGDFASAQNAFRNALRLSKGDSDGYNAGCAEYALADIAAKQRQIGEAQDHVKRAIDAISASRHRFAPRMHAVILRLQTDLAAQHASADRAMDFANRSYGAADALAAERITMTIKMVHGAILRKLDDNAAAEVMWRSVLRQAEDAYDIRALIQVHDNVARLYGSERKLDLALTHFQAEKVHAHSAGHFGAEIRARLGAAQIYYDLGAPELITDEVSDVERLLLSMPDGSFLRQLDMLKDKMPK